VMCSLHSIVSDRRQMLQVTDVRYNYWYCHQSQAAFDNKSEFPVILTLWYGRVTKYPVRFQVLTAASMMSSGIYCRVKWLLTDVSEVCTASIIRDEWLNKIPY
jgi:hypothetical protein